MNGYHFYLIHSMKILNGTSNKMLLRCITIALFLIKYSVSANESTSNKPHIITILIDDLGWNDVGFHGSNQISTPNIDALAYSGIILNRHYVLPTCTPSRAALLTGYYPIRSGLQGYPMKCGTRRVLPLSLRLKPEYLKRLGYRTHLVGKWHLGYRSEKFIPNRRGFDTFFGYYNGYLEYFKHGVNQSFEINGQEHYYYGFDMHDGNEIAWKSRGKYATRLFSEQAGKIIRNHDKSEPMYMLMAHLGVHTGSDIGDGLETPSDVNVDEAYPYIKHKERREFAVLLEELDNSVGELVKYLEEANMLNNSIILVISDNGGHPVSTDMNPNWSSNWPLRGTKFTMFEGGVRGAALIWSPMLPKGVVSEEFFHITDWLPTFYTAAGGNPADLDKLDGINQWKALQTLEPVERDHILLNADEIEGEEAIILRNRWKLKKGGIREYANYDYHWGEEENILPPPDRYYEKIRKSLAGRIISALQNYEDSLQKDKVEHLRSKSQIVCEFEKDTKNIKVHKGFVENSRNFLCAEHCIFDLINDPCELNPIVNSEVLHEGKKLLKMYKKQARPPGKNIVDVASDPSRWGGVWMPWEHDDFSKCVASEETCRL